jgi:type IV pilus assembly protein PilF
MSAVVRIGTILCLALLLGACAGSGPKGDKPKDTERPGDIYVGMAAAYLQRGQLETALERGLLAVKEDKKNPQAHYVLSLIYRQLGQTDEAEEHMGEAVRLDPDNPDFLNARGTILCLQRQYVEAIRQFDAAVAQPLYRTPEVALWNAADCSRRAGRLQQAEDYLRRALSRNPRFPPALLAMAKQQYAAGAYREANDYMTRYSRVGGASPEVLLLAVRIQRRLGNREQAEGLAAVLRKRFPDAPEIMQL